MNRGREHIYKEKPSPTKSRFFFCSRKSFFWVLCPLLNFFYWFHLGSKDSALQARLKAQFLESEVPLTAIFNASVPGKEVCPEISKLPPPEVFERMCPRTLPLRKPLRLPPMNGGECSLETMAPPAIEVVDPFEFGKFKTRDLVQLNYYGYTLTLNYDPGTACERYVNPTANRRHPCFALVKAEVEESFRRVRFDSKPELGGRLKGGKWRNSRVPTGVFREVPKLKGREVTTTFLKYLVFFCRVATFPSHYYLDCAATARKNVAIT